MRFFPEGFWLLCVAATCSARSEGGNKARSCSELRQLYGAKGFSPNVVPQAEISGEHLRICPQGYTCCTSEMEENFANKSRSEFEGMLKEATRSVQIIFTAQYKNFDESQHRFCIVATRPRCSIPTVVLPRHYKVVLILRMILFYPSVSAAWNCVGFFGNCSILLSHI